MDKTIDKTDGDCNIIVIDNPDYYNEENKFIKKRKKPIHKIPKKKKRKK